MTTAINANTLQEIHFDDATAPEYAAAYGHFVESAGLASWFFAQIQDGKTEWMERVIKGKYHYLCGDWAARF